MRNADEKSEKEHENKNAGADLWDPDRGTRTDWNYNVQVFLGCIEGERNQ